MTIRRRSNQLNAGRFQDGTSRAYNRTVREMIAVMRETWRSFWNLPWVWKRLVAGGIVGLVFMLIVAWRFMVPLMLLAFLIAMYFRYSRSRDAL